MYISFIPTPFLFHLFFFLIHSATTEIYTLSLHDALPIFGVHRAVRTSAPARSTCSASAAQQVAHALQVTLQLDRKSTRLNSSHRCISYAVFCLKKKKKITRTPLNAKLIF